MERQTKPNPSFRQPWFWFVLTPLITTIIAGIAMIILSLENNDGLVKDTYFKSGKSINRTFEQDKMATLLALQAHLSVSPFEHQKHNVVINLEGKLNSAPESLNLSLIFPTQQSKDIVLTLERTNDDHIFQYHASLETQLQHRRYITITPKTEEGFISPWRLKGEINFSEATSFTAASPISHISGQ